MTPILFLIPTMGTTVHAAILWILLFTNRIFWLSLAIRIFLW